MRHACLLLLATVLVSCGNEATQSGANPTGDQATEESRHNTDLTRGNADPVRETCEIYRDGSIEFRSQFGQDPFADLLVAFRAPRDLAAFFGELARVAPDEIDQDLQEVADLFDEAADNLVENASSPLDAAASGFVAALTSGGSMERVDRWIGENCSNEIAEIAAASPPAGEMAPHADPPGSLAHQDSGDCAIASTINATLEVERLITIRAQVRSGSPTSVIVRVDGVELLAESFGGIGDIMDAPRDFSVTAPAGYLEIEYGGNQLGGCSGSFEVWTL